MNQPQLYLAISLLHAAYAQAIDDDRLEDWPGFFTEDCFYSITSHENHARGLEAGIIYCDSNGMLKDRVSGLREANIYEQQRYRHIISMPSLVVNEVVNEVASQGANEGASAGGASVKAVTPFAVYRITRNRPSELFVTGCYHDQLLISGDTLKIARRVVVCDSSVFDTLLAIPL